MGTVPTLRTWASGERITGSKLNEIRDALSFAYNPPLFHASNTNGVTCVNGTATRFLVDNVIRDTDGMYQASPGRCVFQTAGRFQITLGVQMPAATYTQMNINPRINSANNPAGGTSIVSMSQYSGWSGGQLHHIFEREFAVGDYLEPFITQSSGANRTTSFPIFNTFIMARWVSA